MSRGSVRSLVIATVALAVVGIASLVSPPCAEAGRPVAPPLEVTLTPWAEMGPFVYRLSIMATEDVRAVIDRRLLRFRVSPDGSRRRLRCRHPDRRSRVSSSRVREMREGQRVVEWIDIRMYCSGRARRALSSGATITAEYGFPRRGRRRYIAQRDGVRFASRISLADHRREAVEAVPSPNVSEDVAVRLSAATGRRAPALRVRVSAPTGKRLYFRDDLLWFTIRGPLGETTCRPSRQPINPIRDFYRRRARTSVDPRAYCEDHPFPVPGVYEVTPHVDLVYDGTRYGLDVVTGTFEGAPGVVRVRGRGRAYLEQTEQALRDARR